MKTKDYAAVGSDSGLDDTLGSTVVALRAVLTTHWEEAAAFAEHALRRLTCHAAQWKTGLQSFGIQIAHLKWTLHTILGR